MNKVDVAIIGAGPYGLSLAAHLGIQNLDHRVFGRPMQFWSDVASAAGERYLKSFCFATNLSTPTAGYSFVDYNRARSLETFDPCSIANFSDYGRWFQHHNVPWAESVDVVHVEGYPDGFAVLLDNGERVAAKHVVVATGLSGFAQIPPALASLPGGLVTHTAHIKSFESFKGRRVAVVGAGQSALEASALLAEAGALPELLVREDKLLWADRTALIRNIWQRMRRPASGLGVGPKAWALVSFPGALHRLPDGWRTSLVKNHLRAEGAWWLRPRVEGRVRISLDTTIRAARAVGSSLELELCNSKGQLPRWLSVDHVILGVGYDINVDRLSFLDTELRSAIRRTASFPELDANFQSSVRGLHFLGPMSARSFGPLFRFVGGAEYTAETVAAHLAAASKMSVNAPAQLRFRSAA